MGSHFPGPGLESWLPQMVPGEKNDFCHVPVLCTVWTRLEASPRGNGGTLWNAFRSHLELLWISKNLDSVQYIL